jgi:GWxTD domain-containing protein
MMVRLSIALLLLLLIIPLWGERSFVFDVSRFSWNDKITEVEIHYAIPYNLLSYHDEEGTLKALFKVMVTLENIDTKEVLVDSLERTSVIPSKEVAKERNLVAIEQIKFYFKPGRYRITLDLIDSNTGSKNTKSEIIVVDSLKSAISLSDIELATLIEEDTTSGQFTKNGLKVIPNPSGVFGEGRSMLYYYFEIYNLKKDQNPYSVLYTILDETGSVLTTIGPTQREKNDSLLFDVDIGGLNLVAFKEGFYTLKVEIDDGGETTTQVKDFQVRKPSSVVVDEETPFFSEEELKYVGKIEYLASSKEISEYNSLSDTGKVGFIKRFWIARDPDPTTPFNEGLEEFIKRINYVDDKYSTSFKKGYNTDRGRIYIRYGSPDDVERAYFEIGYKPYEIWEFFSYGGYRFVFSDLDGDGDFVLIYSSTPKEPTMPNWERYVPEDAGVMHGE